MNIRLFSKQQEIVNQEEPISFPIGKHISLREPSISHTVNDLVLQTKTFARAQDKRQILSTLADQFNINNLQQKPEKKEPLSIREDRQIKQGQEPTLRITKIIFKPKPKSIINNLKEVYGK